MQGFERTLPPIQSIAAFDARQLKLAVEIHGSERKSVADVKIAPTAVTMEIVRVDVESRSESTWIVSGHQPGLYHLRRIFL